MNFPPTMHVPGLNPISSHQVAEVDEKEEVEKKTEELIIMAGNKGPRRWRQRKKEYIKKLEQDNAQLKTMIIDLQQRISAYQAQKDIFKDQLNYFQGCLAQAAPYVFQSQQNQGNNINSKNTFYENTIIPPNQ